MHWCIARLERVKTSRPRKSLRTARDEAMMRTVIERCPRRGIRFSTVLSPWRGIATEWRGSRRLPGPSRELLSSVADLRDKERRGIQPKSTTYLAQDKHLDYHWCGTHAEINVRMAAPDWQVLIIRRAQHDHRTPRGSETRRAAWRLLIKSSDSGWALGPTRTRCGAARRRAYR